MKLEQARHDRVVEQALAEILEIADEMRHPHIDTSEDTPTLFPGQEIPEERLDLVVSWAQETISRTGQLDLTKARQLLGHQIEDGEMPTDTLVPYDQAA